MIFKSRGWITFYHIRLLLTMDTGYFECVGSHQFELKIKIKFFPSLHWLTLIHSIWANQRFDWQTKLQSFFVVASILCCSFVSFLRRQVNVHRYHWIDKQYAFDVYLLRNYRHVRIICCRVILSKSIDSWRQNTIIIYISFDDRWIRIKNNALLILYGRFFVCVCNLSFAEQRNKHSMFIDMNTEHWT